MMIFDHASFICRLVKPNLHCAESSCGMEFWIYLWLKTVISIIVMVDYWRWINLYLQNCCPTMNTYTSVSWRVWESIRWTAVVTLEHGWERQQWLDFRFVPLCHFSKIFCCCCCYCWFPGLWYCVVLSVIPTFQRNILPPLSGYKIVTHVLDEPGASICWRWVRRLHQITDNPGQDYGIIT